MTTPSSGPRQAGAAAVDPGKKKRPLVPVLLGLLALLVAAAIVIYLLADSDSSKKAAPSTHPSTPPTSAQAPLSTNSTVAQSATSQPSVTSQPAPSAPAASAPAASTGSLSSDTGTSLLGIAATHGADAQVGHQVTGTNAVVQGPMDLKDGFWVGDSPSDAYFVDLADSLTTTPTGPVVPLTQGQPVNLTGQLVANTPAYLAEATSDGIPNVSQITAEGYHIATTPEQVHGA